MRTALVTGGAGGLAAGIAAELARSGFGKIALTYRNTPPDSTIAAIRESGAEAVAARVDFSADESEIAATLEALVNEHGPFDTLVHGVGPIVVKRFERLTMDDYRDMFDGNVRSTVLAAHAVLPSMRAAHFGRIIVFGMNGSSETRPFRGFTLYGAAKSAVAAFARCLAVEEAKHGITVNVIEPGDIRQKEISRAEARTLDGRAPRGRPGSYQDVADVVAFLAAAERDFVTGAVIGVTGGLTEADERNASRP